MYLTNSFSLRSQFRKLLLITIFMSLADLLAQDAELIAIGKEKFYSQDSASGAVLETEDPYGGFAYFGESSSGSILATPVPTFTPPGLSPIELEFDEDGWNAEIDFPDQSTLDTTLPNGTYTINYTGANDGDVTGSLTITGDAYPNAPSLTEAFFNALQSGSLSAGVTIEWVPFQGGDGPNDFILVEVESIGFGNSDIIFETEPFELNGTITSVAIPAGLLEDGGGYEVCIQFFNAVNMTTIGGAQAAAFYASDNCVEFGDTSRKDLQFGFSQDAGSFNDPANNQVTTNIFPITNAQFDLTYTFQDFAGSFPDKSLVIFDGPAGSPISGLVPFQFSGPDQGEGQGFYRIERIVLPADGSSYSGTYRVSVSDAEVFSKEVDFPLLLDQNLIVVPTVNLNGDNTIQSIDIVYRTTDDQPASSTAFIQEMGISIFGADFSRLYEEFNLPGNTTNIMPPAGINRNDVEGLGFFYFTELRNFYNTFYSSAPPVEEDIFGGIDIQGGFPGWKSSPWYMNYNVDFWPWIYHDEHGWQFVFPGSTDSVIFLWDLGLGEWIFFNESSYRWIFVFGGDNAGWVFTFGDNTPDRRFFQRLDNGSLFSVPAGLPVE